MGLPHVICMAAPPQFNANAQLVCLNGQQSQAIDTFLNASSTDDGQVGTPYRVYLALCRLGQIFQILFVLRLFRQEGELMEKSVQMHLIIDVVFIYLAVDHIFHILSHPFLIRFPRRGRPR